MTATIATGRTEGAPATPEHVSPYALAAGGGWIWATRVVDSRVAVVKVDPRRNAVAAVFPIAAVPIPYALAYGHGSVWLTLREANLLLRLSPQTGRVLAHFDVLAPTGVVADNPVWVASSRDDDVQLVDPAANRVVAHVPVPPGVETLALCGTALWVASGSGWITRIDAGARRVVARIALPADPWTVDCDDGHVWAGA